MDIGDFFRSFFGLRRGSRYDNRFYPSPSDDEHEERPTKENPVSPEASDIDGDEFSFFFGNDGNLDDMFRHFHGDVFRQMESLHRQMDEMMKGFGPITSELEPHNPMDNPSINDSDGQKNGKETFTWFFNQPSRDSQFKNPRDFMLKDKTDESPPRDSVVPAPNPPNNHERFDFRGTFHLPPWNRARPEKKEDTDLDDKVNQKEVLDLIKRSDSPKQNENVPSQPGFFSSGSSMRMTTIHGPDGRVEQKKVVRDSSGQEQTTVTRSLGSQTHSVTTVLDGEGHKERRENFQNMDEKDLSKFEELWNNSQSRRPIVPNEDTSVHIHPNDRNLFARLFGGSW